MPGRALTAAGVVLGIAVAWIMLLPTRPAAQPIAFNHARHQALACAACHRGVETAEHATLPGPKVCANCHAAAPRGVGPAQWTALERSAVNWVRVTRMPEHVMFSHRRHVTLGGLACESCHADIGQWTAPPGRAPIRLDMATCRACHQSEGASEDCIACHR